MDYFLLFAVFVVGLLVGLSLLLCRSCLEFSRGTPTQVVVPSSPPSVNRGQPATDRKGGVYYTVPNQ